MNERIKILRETLGFSQEEFGKQIGFTKSGISNMETGFRKISEKHLKLISMTFNVSYEWLTTGNGEMFQEKKETQKSYLNSLAEKYEIDDFLKSLVASYLELNEAEQKAVQKFFGLTKDNLK